MFNLFRCQCTLSSIVSHFWFCLFYYFNDFSQFSLLRTFSFISVTFMFTTVDLSCFIVTSVIVFFILACVNFNVIHIFKFCLHFPLTIANVIFWHGRHRASHKFSFGLFQGVTLVLMSHSYHVGMYRTHSQSFKHFHTSVVVVIAKCTHSVALG